MYISPTMMSTNCICI